MKAILQHWKIWVSWGFLREEMWSALNLQKIAWGWKILWNCFQDSAIGIRWRPGKRMFIKWVNIMAKDLKCQQSQVCKDFWTRNTKSSKKLLKVLCHQQTMPVGPIVEIINLYYYYYYLGPKPLVLRHLKCVTLNYPIGTRSSTSGIIKSVNCQDWPVQCV